MNRTLCANGRSLAGAALLGCALLASCATIKDSYTATADAISGPYALSVRDCPQGVSFVCLASAEGQYLIDVEDQAKTGSIDWLSDSRQADYWDFITLVPAAETKSFTVQFSGRTRGEGFISTVEASTGFLVDVEVERAFGRQENDPTFLAAVKYTDGTWDVYVVRPSEISQLDGGVFEVGPRQIDLKQDG